MMRMAVLGSGSGGNATVVQCGSTTILIDAGLSAKQLRLRLNQLGVEVAELDAILLTHEHSDHTKGVKVLLKDTDIPVYANALTRECLQHKLGEHIQWKIFQSGSPFDINQLEIAAFPIPHDAQEPVGFTVQSKSTKLGVLTDIGYVTGVVKNALCGLDALFVEANYDMALLEADMKRPWSIKQRISSRHGHLSNEQTAELISEIHCNKLQNIILGHLSSDCNTAHLAKKAVLQQCQHKKLNAPQKIIAASQDIPTEWVEFGEVVTKIHTPEVNPPKLRDGTFGQLDLFS